LQSGSTDLFLRILNAAVLYIDNVRLIVKIIVKNVRWSWPISGHYLNIYSEYQKETAKNFGRYNWYLEEIRTKYL